MHFNRQWPNKCDITLAGREWLEFRLKLVGYFQFGPDYPGGVGGVGEVMGQFAFPSGLNDLQHIWISYQDQITATGGSLRRSRAHKNLQPFGLRRRNSDVTRVCLLGGTAVALLASFQRTQSKPSQLDQVRRQERIDHEWPDGKHKKTAVYISVGFNETRRGRKRQKASRLIWFRK